MAVGIVRSWRELNSYTWHELNDTQTMQLVPTKINSKFSHVGGGGEIRIKNQLGGDIGE